MNNRFHTQTRSGTNHKQCLGPTMEDCSFRGHASNSTDQEEIEELKKQMAEMKTMMAGMVIGKEQPESKAHLDRTRNFEYGGISEQDSLGKQSGSNIVKIYINREAFKHEAVQEEKLDRRPCCPIPMTYTELFPTLVEKGLLVPVPSRKCGLYH